MRLTYSCSSCKQQNYYSPKMPSRAELQMKFGDEVKVNCSNCGKLEKKHLNRISAKVDNRIVATGFFGGLITILLLGAFLWENFEFTIGSWKLLAFVSSVIAGLPLFLWNSENRAVRRFNSYVIQRR